MRSFWSLNDEMRPECKVTFVKEIDATAMDQKRLKAQATNGHRPSYTALIVEAAAKILKKYPITNRGLTGPFFFKRLVQFNSIDIAVAVEKDMPDSEAVVLTHILRSCDEMTPQKISEELSIALTTETERWQLFSKVLNRIPPFLCKWILRLAAYLPSQWVEHRGGACFVNSPAKYGIDLVIADMLWPLTFSFGEVKERPIVLNGRLEVRRTVALTMIFDRRIMQGAVAARIFNDYCESLETSSELKSKTSFQNEQPSKNMN